jgi:WD40 repeat protein
MTLRGHTETKKVESVAFSPDGRRLATASDDKTAKIWDAETGKELATLRGHEEPVRSVAFSPDGRRLATASADDTAKIWDDETGRELMTLRSHEDGVTSVAFSPDGRRLATAGNDNTVQVYALDIHDLLALARSRVTRDLTPDECMQYFDTSTCPKLP